VNKNCTAYLFGELPRLLLAKPNFFFFLQLVSAGVITDYQHKQMLKVHNRIYA
jgi:hypothetical protein